MSDAPDINEIRMKHGDKAARDFFDSAKPFEPNNGNGAYVREEPPPHGEPEPPIEPFEMFDAGDWEGKKVEPEPYLVRDRIPLGEPGIITGDGGIGKTTLVCQLAVPVALERPDWSDWVNGVIETHGPVLLFSAEERLRRLQPLIERILASRGRSFKELKGRFKLICDPNNEPILATVDRLTGLVRPTRSLLRLERNVKLVRPVLIIVENASDVFGGNGNDPAAVKRFVTRHLGGLCAISGATLALIQHPSVSGMNDGTGRAGTVQWRNAGRWFLNFVSADRNKDDTRDDGDRELIVDKLNYGRPGERVRIRWNSGVFVPVPVGSAFERAAAEMPIDEAFLRCLDIKSAQLINVFFHKGRGYAPAMFEGMAEAGGYKRPALAKAMERLMSDGRIKNEPYGPPSRSSVRLVRC